MTSLAPSSETFNLVGGGKKPHGRREGNRGKRVTTFSLGVHSASFDLLHGWPGRASI